MKWARFRFGVLFGSSRRLDSATKHVEVEGEREEEEEGEGWGGEEWLDELVSASFTSLV